MEFTPAVVQEFKYELARREFFYFCHLLEGDFYEYDRQYLVDLCDALQDFYEGDIYNVLILNLPPHRPEPVKMGAWQKPQRKGDDWILQCDFIQDICQGSAKCNQGS